MQNTFSQSGNDSKWFSKKIIFQNRYVELETPPPFMEKTILDFDFDYLNPRLRHREYCLQTFCFPNFQDNFCPCFLMRD